MAARDKNETQSERTREALVAAARRLFADKGYGATGTEEIVAAAGVTRGALYHQYKDKAALFLDVVEHVERDLMGRIAERIAGLHDPIVMLRTASAAFLDECLNEEVRRIALVDAPSVLGWEVWREIDVRYGLGMLQVLLGLAAEQGWIEAEQVVPLSHLFLGAVSEAGMVVAHHPDDPAVRARMGENIGWWIDRVFASSP